MSRVMSELR